MNFQTDGNFKRFSDRLRGSLAGCLISHLVAISTTFQLLTSLRFDFNVIGEVE